MATLSQEFVVRLPVEIIEMIKQTAEIENRTTDQIVSETLQLSLQYSSKYGNIESSEKYSFTEESNQRRNSFPFRSTPFTGKRAKTARSPC